MSLLDPLLEIFCREFSIPALPQKDNKGMYQLPINSSTKVSLQELDPGVFLFSKLTPLPKATTLEAFFIYLMRANFLGGSTGGSALGIDPKEQFLTLSSTFSHELNYPTFCELLETFLNYLDFWRKTIDHYQQSPLS